MGQLHKQRSIYLQKRALKSVAFSIAVTAHNHCGYPRLKSTPPEVIYRYILNCIKEIWSCKDSHRNKTQAVSFCWDSYQEVTDWTDWQEKKSRAGIEGQEYLDLHNPSDWGNAIGPAVVKKGRYTRPIEAVSYDAFIEPIEDEDGEANLFYSWESEVITGDEDGEGPESNTPCF